jgi:hypothetical protein
MSVATKSELQRAMELLADADYRQNYVTLAQTMINDRFGGLTVAKRFFDGVCRQWPLTAATLENRAAAE